MMGKEETLRRLNAAIEACNKPRYQRRFPARKAALFGTVELHKYTCTFWCSVL